MCCIRIQKNWYIGTFGTGRMYVRNCHVAILITITACFRKEAAFLCFRHAVYDPRQHNRLFRGTRVRNTAVSDPHVPAACLSCGLILILRRTFRMFYYAAMDTGLYDASESHVDLWFLTQIRVLFPFWYSPIPFLLFCLYEAYTRFGLVLTYQKKNRSAGSIPYASLQICH